VKREASAHVWSVGPPRSVGCSHLVPKGDVPAMVDVSKIETGDEHVEGWE
jgi:hypothetical protein